MDTFTDLAAAAPGLQGLIYDTALRGVHHQQMLRTLGILPVNKVAAAEGSGPRTKGRKRIEKSTFVETRIITAPDGTTHTIDASPAPAPSGSPRSPTTAPWPSCRYDESAPAGPGTRSAPTAGTTTTASPGTWRRRDHRPPPRQRRRHQAALQPHRERPAHPPVGPRFQGALPAPQRRREHQPRLDDTMWLRRPHHRAPAPAPQPADPRSRRQRPRRAPLPASQQRPAPPRRCLTAEPPARHGSFALRPQLELEIDARSR